MDLRVDIRKLAPAALALLSLFAVGSRMHVVTHLLPKYQGTMNHQSGYGLEEAGMAQAGDDGRGISTHAGACLFQPECSQGQDRRDDQGTRWPIARLLKLPTSQQFEIQ